MVREWVKRYPLVNLIGATADDARDIMIEGESGILAICPRADRPIYKKSDRQLHWPNGARSLIFTADEPERLRGKQHMKLWADEIAAWRYPAAWDQAIFGLRLGDDPQSIITTTPRPTPLIKELIADPNTVVTRGTTYENAANLAEAFLGELIKKYEGTRLGRQELRAEILDDNPDAFWKRAMIEGARVHRVPVLSRVVVAVDPPGSSTGAEAGIVAAGVGMCSCKGRPELHGFVLDDRSLRGSPAEWGARAVTTYHIHKGDRIVGEQNNGGEMVEHTIHTVEAHVPYKSVHASRGKALRAEPVSALYEQGKVHHVGTLPQLEDQMCQWDPSIGESPDRLDALVWALTDLMLVSAAPGRQSNYMDR